MHTGNIHPSFESHMWPIEVQKRYSGHIPGLTFEETRLHLIKSLMVCTLLLKETIYLSVKYLNSSLAIIDDHNVILSKLFSDVADLSWWLLLPICPKTLGR